MARGYAVFANGGYLVEPHFITRIEDIEGNLLFKSKPQQTKTTSDRMINARNVFTMNSLLRGVIQNGTGIRAKSLGRKDLAGKTGTTNDNIDAWFAVFNGVSLPLPGSARTNPNRWEIKRRDQKLLCRSGSIT